MHTLRTIVATAVITLTMSSVAMAGVNHLTGQKDAGATAFSGDGSHDTPKR